MKEVILLGIIILVGYYLIKHISGGIIMGVTIAVSLLVVYIIITRVLFINIPPDINLPKLFKSTDQHIEQIEENNSKYEYRKVFPEEGK